MGTDALLLHISAFTHASFIGLQERFLASLEMTMRESMMSPSHQSLNPAFKLLGIPFSRIVISSASEKSFLQTDKRCMCESRNT